MFDLSGETSVNVTAAFAARRPIIIDRALCVVMLTSGLLAVLCACAYCRTRSRRTHAQWWPSSLEKQLTHFSIGQWPPRSHLNCLRRIPHPLVIDAVSSRLHGWKRRTNERTCNPSPNTNSSSSTKASGGLLGQGRHHTIETIVMLRDVLALAPPNRCAPSDRRCSGRILTPVLHCSRTTLPKPFTCRRRALGVVLCAVEQKER